MVTNYEFPKFIEIQTNSICNGMCVTCPYEEMSKKFKPMKMKDELLEKILEECDRNKDKIERIIPYFNNEPTLDHRFLSILKRIKQQNHFVEVSTNASGLTEEMIYDIVRNHLIDDFRISFFGGTKEIYHQLMPNLNFDHNKETIEKLIHINEEYHKCVDMEIVVVLCPWMDMEENIKQIQNLFQNRIRIHCFGYLDRAGNVKDHVNEKLVNILEENLENPLAGCELNRPFERMNILSDGTVVICSQDWGREVVIGNLSEKSMTEIWSGETLHHIRSIVLGETNVCPNDFICTKCKLAMLKTKGTQEPVRNFKGDHYMSEYGEKLILVQ